MGQNGHWRGEKSQRRGVRGGRSLWSSGAVSWQNGLCLGHGSRLPLRKATFEPHVGSLKILLSLSSSRNRHLFFPCRPWAGPALPCSSQRGAIVRAAPWASHLPLLPPPLGCNPGARGWVSRLSAQPTSPPYSRQHTSTAVSAFCTRHLNSSFL